MTLGTHTVTYIYDVMNRLATVQKNGEATPATYYYDPAGRRVALELPNGVHTDYAYNTAGHLVDLLTTKPGAEEDDPRITLARFMYTVDATGNRTAIDQNLNGTIHHLAYTFDNAYRLTGETRTDTGGGLLYQEQFSYDALGNRLTQLKNGTTTNRSYNSANQLMTEIENPGTPNQITKTYSYDANGNNTGFTSTDGTSQTMTYDWLNRMTSWSDGTKSEQTIYRGAEWKRITTVANAGTDTTTTHYLYDGDNVCADYVCVEETANILFDRLYVTPKTDHNLSMTRSTGETYYYSQDGIGSVRSLTQASAVVCWYDYTAFGEKLEVTTSEGIYQRYTYTGRECSAIHTRMFNRWRRYTPKNGLFSSRDSLVYSGSPNGALYGYAKTNSINYTDPYGLTYEKYIDTITLSSTSPFSFEETVYYSYDVWRDRGESQWWDDEQCKCLKIWFTQKVFLTASAKAHAKEYTTSYDMYLVLQEPPDSTEEKMWKQRIKAIIGAIPAVGDLVMHGSEMSNIITHMNDNLGLDLASKIQYRNGITKEGGDITRWAIGKYYDPDIMTSWKMPQKLSKENCRQYNSFKVEKYGFESDSDGYIYDKFPDPAGRNGL